MTNKRVGREMGAIGASSMRRTFPWVITLLVMMLPPLAACQGRGGTTPVGIVGYNHTDATIYEFLINGGGGGSVGGHRGGGTTVCCATVPNRWRPGLKVEIKWTTNLKDYQTQMVSIPKYDEIGDLAVHFLRSGEVKVFVSNPRLGHPDYPLTGPEAGLNEGEDPVRKDLLDARTRGKL